MKNNTGKMLTIFLLTKSAKEGNIIIPTGIWYKYKYVNYCINYIFYMLNSQKIKSNKQITSFNFYLLTNPKSIVLSFRKINVLGHILLISKNSLNYSKWYFIKHGIHGKSHTFTDVFEIHIHPASSFCISYQINSSSSVTK